VFPPNVQRSYVAATLLRRIRIRTDFRETKMGENGTGLRHKAEFGGDVKFNVIEYVKGSISPTKCGRDQQTGWYGGL